jgi:hypothetical protein
VPVGAQPTETGAGPLSAELVVDGTIDEVANELLTGLGAWTLDVVEVSSPVEDGSRTIELEGGGRCVAQVVVGPLGSTTLLTVRYGAACPWE